VTTRAAVNAARQELLTSSDADLERRTAETWCARAIAGYELAGERRCVRWLVRAVGYHLEASEHAAGVSAHFLELVETTLAQCKAAALAALGA
jgi:hypothetical protein